MIKTGRLLTISSSRCSFNSTSAPARKVQRAYRYRCTKYWNIWYMGHPASPLSIGIYWYCFRPVSIRRIYAIFLPIFIHILKATCIINNDETKADFKKIIDDTAAGVTRVSKEVTKDKVSFPENKQILAKVTVDELVTKHEEGSPLPVPLIGIRLNRNRTYCISKNNWASDRLSNWKQNCSDMRRAMSLARGRSRAGALGGGGGGGGMPGFWAQFSDAWQSETAPARRCPPL